MTDELLDAAIAALRRGGLIAMPTETVYGLGADANQRQAVESVFRVKGRPTDHPLIVHLADADAMARWASTVPAAAARLAAAFWPGPITLLVPVGRRIDRVVTGGRDTIGLRVPAHPVALELLRRFGGGIAAPSANRFGRVSPTTAAHVRDELGDAVDVIIDAGPCRVGVESTIVDCTRSIPQILRPGGVSSEQIEALVGAIRPPSGPSRAPGMLDSHYAPACRLTILPAGSKSDGAIGEVVDLSTDPSEAAAVLYDRLRDLDRRGVQRATVIAPVEAGIGIAVNDRLRKAAAGR